MEKVIRIFKKDSLHLWPELLLTMGLTFAFAATQHLTWPAYSTERYALPQSEVIAVWVMVLMPISWWLVIARAVHDESLVGDLQFWVTRPYSWSRLLAAKLLFLLVYILLPFFLAQLFLLVQAGLHPSAVLPGLALKLLLLLGFLLLPLMALSTVTSSLARMLLLFLALIVYAGLAMYFISLFFSRPAPWLRSVETSNPWNYLFFLTPAVAIAVILLQYARRRTFVSAAMLVVLIALLTAAITGQIRPHHRDSAGNPIGFPNVAPGETSPVQIAFNPDPAFIPTQPERAAAGFTSGVVPPPFSLVYNLSIPILLSGIAPGHAVRIDGVLVEPDIPGETLVPGTAPEPFEANATWRMIGNAPFISSSTPIPWRDSVPISRKRYLAAMHTSLSIHSTYAVTELEPDATSTESFTGAPIDLPQNGHCLERNGILFCQYAIVGPSLTRVTWPHASSCGAPSSHTSANWIGSNDVGLLNPTFTPITNQVDLFEDQSLHSNQPCPGSQITFTRFKVLRHRLLHVAIPSIDPSLYVVQPQNRK